MIYSRLLKINSDYDSSFFLLGPRGTGKTHWLTHHFHEACTIDLLDHPTRLELMGQPQLLEQRLAPHHRWVVIDEIQRLPILLDTVHRLIEQRGIRFAITGSSARSLRRQGVNLLGGRAHSFGMHPLVQSEMGQDFDLAFALKYGMLPLAYRVSHPDEFLKGYVHQYLQEEIQQEAITRNIPSFTRFLTASAFSQGEIVNYTAIARDVGTSRQTISNYFDILDDLLLAIRLPVFKRRAKRDTLAQPKFYWFDVGVYRALRPKGPLDSEAECQGPALETLFLQHLRALNDYERWHYELYYWHTRTHQEVDFVLYGERGLHAFEIKRKTTLQPHDFKGLKLFQSDYPEAQCRLIYGGSRRYWHEQIDVVPFDQALPELPLWLGG